jgi:hypothetical protein
MPSLFNGAGTAYYGRRKLRADGSYVTTEFFVFLYFPLVPLRSWRVRPKGAPTEFYARRWIETMESWEQNYQVVREPLDSLQVVTIYLAALCKIFAVIVGFALFIIGLFDVFEMISKANSLTAKLWVGSIGVLLILGGIGLLYWILLGRRMRRFERVQPTS